MLKTLILITALLIGSIGGKAQQLKPNDTIKAKKYTYLSKSIRYGRIELVNERGIYHSMKDKPQPDIDFKESEGFNTLNAFEKVFSTIRLKELIDEPNLLLKYYITSDGKIHEVGFYVKQNTLITPAELEELEDTVKNKVSFILPVSQTKSLDFITLYKNVLFRKVLAGLSKN